MTDIRARTAQAVETITVAAAYLVSDGYRELSDDVRAIGALLEELAGMVPPAGWQVVPIEPTAEMVRAGFSPFLAAHDPMFSKNEPCGPIYRTMLAAAPPPPAPEKGGEG